MGSNDSKRQKRLLKKKKKRQAKKASLTRQVNLGGLFHTLTKGVDDYPVLTCLVSKNIFQTGMGSVIFTRTLSPGSVALGMFLIDGWCLGVKNAFLEKITPSELKEVIRDCNHNELLEIASPEYTRKLVEDCAEYAAGIGFMPHNDYREAQVIFGSVDPAECSEEFTFGDAGEPHFISGPDDHPARCLQIVETLKATCGAGNFYTTIPFMQDLTEEEDDDDDIGGYVFDEGSRGFIE